MDREKINGECRGEADRGDGGCADWAERRTIPSKTNY